MKYFDKALGRMIYLTESRTDFIVVVKPDDSEAVKSVLSHPSFSVTKSTETDDVYVLQARPEMEKVHEGENILRELADNPHIQAVAPAVIDAEGFLRFTLPNTVVVQFKGLDEQEAAEALHRVGSSVRRKLRSLGLYEAEVPSELDVQHFIDLLNLRDDVVYGEPVYFGVGDQEISVRFDLRGPLGSGATEPAPPTGVLSLPWHLEVIRTSEAWTISQGSSDVVIAVVDGVPDTSHAALAGKFIGAITDDLVFSNDLSVSSHATSICSVAAAESAALFGVSPKLRLVPIVVNLYAQAYVDRAEAIRAVADLSRARAIGSESIARIILSCSWKTSGDITSIRLAMEDAISAGVVIVCSAGNDNSNAPHYPSDYSGRGGTLGDGVISVGATMVNDRKAPYSNYSPTIDLCAPGGDGLPLDAGDILCADKNNGISYAAGTSIAVPLVAGTIGLMLSVDPSLSPRTIKSLLKECVDDISGMNGTYYGMLGAGRINASRAVELAKRQLETLDPGPEVVDQLARCSDALQSATGWSLASADLQKGNLRTFVTIR